MIKVFSDNKEFNITQSLYEAITKNDPQLLEEKARSNKKYNDAVAARVRDKRIDNDAQKIIDKENEKEASKQAEDELEINRKKKEFQLKQEEKVKSEPQIVQNLYKQIKDWGKENNIEVSNHQSLKLAIRKADQIANEKIANAINTLTGNKLEAKDFKSVEVGDRNKNDKSDEQIQKEADDLFREKMEVLNALETGDIDLLSPNNFKRLSDLYTGTESLELGQINPTSMKNYSKVEQLKKETQKNKDPKRYKNLDDKRDDDTNLIYNDLTDFVNDEDLFKEIDNAEENAEYIIKRSKSLIQKYTGNIGTNVTLDRTHQQYKNYIPQQPQVQTSADNQSNTSEQSVGETFNYLNEDNIGTQDIRDKRKIEDINNKVSYPTFGDRNIKANMQLAIGGFKFSPLFTNSSDDNAGRSLKYVLSSLNSYHSNSHIAMMLNTLVYYKNNPDKYRQMLDDIRVNMKKNNDIDVIQQSNYKQDSDMDSSSISANKVLNPVKQFTDICYSYLRNISYKLEVNGEDSFQQIINVIRLDTRLSERYSINNIMSVQVLNAKKEVLTFKNKDTNNIDCIIFAVPLFAKGKELAKSAQAYWDVIKRHNKV